jgi:hypothetical protein
MQRRAARAAEEANEFVWGPHLLAPSDVDEAEPPVADAAELEAPIVKPASPASGMEVESQGQSTDCTPEEEELEEEGMPSLEDAPVRGGVTVPPVGEAVESMS